MPRTASAWTAYVRDGPAAEVRLFCLPYAGKGPSAYRNYGDLLDERIAVFPVQTPGRERRLPEPAIEDLERLLDELVAALADELVPPFAFFGFSLGAFLGFELAHALAARRLPTPSHLFISTERAPHRLNPPKLTNDLLTDEEFLDDPERVPSDCLMRTDPMLRELMLPTFRADSLLKERYRYSLRPPLSCDMTAFAGVNGHVSEDDLRAWSALASGTFRLCTVPCEPEGFESPVVSRHIAAAITQDLLAYTA